MTLYIHTQTDFLKSLGADRDLCRPLCSPISWCGRGTAMLTSEPKRPQLGSDVKDNRAVGKR